MIEIVAFEPEHAAALEIQPAQIAQDSTPIEMLAARGPTFTAIDLADCRILAIAGLAINHEHYATAWASFSAAKGMAMVPVSRAIARVLDAAASQYRRIDMLVHPGFEAGHRFALDMGFRPEGCMACAGVDGTDLSVWARVRRD